jgi:hypothetical protein
MQDATSLPGLTNLLEVLKSHGIEARSTPATSMVEAGQRVVGCPLDHMLAAVYSRFNDATLGELDIQSLAEIESDGPCRPWDGREYDLFPYGKFRGIAYYFATVPSLAERGGAQPVVFVDSHDDQPIFPIASDVDRAFEFYARYCDRQLRAGGSLQYPDIGESFYPLKFAEDIARDRPLVAMLEAGRFDDLILPDAEDREWVQKVLRAAHAQR